MDFTSTEGRAKSLQFKGLDVSTNTNNACSRQLKVTQEM